MVTRLEPGAPARIGPYQLLAQLGAGATGRVLLGVGADGRLVAIRQLRAHRVTEADLQAVRRVSGPRIAAVVEFDVQSEVPWLASVFVPGPTLDQAVANYGTLTVAQVRTLAAGLVEALQAIHRAGLIHRDLRPGTVILAENGPRVIDVAIARAVEGRSAFMPPEQVRSAPLTPTSDIFSLGAVLAFAAGGTSPFAGSSLRQTLHNIVYAEPELGALAPQVRELVAPCLHKNPGQRPTLDRLLDSLGPVSWDAQPWSDDVHEAIGRQTTNLCALLDDSNSTPGTDGAGPAFGEPYPVVVDEPVAAESGRLRTGEPIVGAPQPLGRAEPPAQGLRRPSFDERLYQLIETARREAAIRRRKRLWVTASVAAAVLVAALVAGVVAVSDSGGATGTAAANPLGALNLTKLRSIDMCEVIQDPLMRGLGGWTRQPTWARWGSCTAEAGGYHFDVDITRSEGFRDGGRTVRGIPVLAEAVARTGCARAVLPAATEPQFVIALRVRGTRQEDRPCGLAEAAVLQLVRRLADRPPQLRNIRVSLARHDPCALVDPIVVTLSIGNQPRGTANELHSCRWESTNTVDVVLDRAPAPAPAQKPIPFDFGGGNVVYVDEAELRATSCTRQSEYRRLDGGTAEVVTVRVTGQSVGEHPELRCASAQKVLQNVMTNLPGGY